MRWFKAVRRSLICWLFLLGACSVEEAKAPLASTAPASVASPASPGDTSAPRSDTWQRVDTALEARRMRFSTGEHSAEVVAVRLDPNTYHIRVAYDAANPGRVSEWAKAIKPVALINGGYFDEAGRATALVIFDGVVRGQSYEGFGGMVVVNADGVFELRSLRQQPYDPSESLRQAMQSSPMLIQPGGEISDLDVNDNRSRRTVIARDTSGRILLIACDWPAFTLREIATLLKESDLEIDAALNLDGGRSTGLYLHTPNGEWIIDSFEPVPLVLVVDKKG